MSSLASFVNPTIGAGPIGPAHVEQRFRLGTTSIGNDGNTYIYVSGGATGVAASAAPVVNASFTITAATGGTKYTAPYAIPANEFGWVRTTTSPL